MRIVVGSDHGGFELKEELKKRLMDQGHEVLDVGCHDKNMVDYPMIAVDLCKVLLAQGQDFGLLCCGTGIGISIAANKVRGIRCALCSDPLSAEMTRRHNDANMLAMGAGMVGPNLAERIVEVFLHTDFEGGRHARRVGLITEMEEA